MQLDAGRIERVFAIPARDWRRELERNLANGKRPEGTSLSIAGYPELHLLSFFLTVEASDRWETTRTLQRPPHEAGPILIEEGVWLDRARYLTLIGRDAAVLVAIRQLNNTGDHIAPWRLFPEYDSYSGFWRQSGEHWLSQVFRPFWSDLNESTRKAYLERWSAPDEWAEFLSLLE